MVGREGESDHTVQIPSARYFEYINGEKECDVSDPSMIKLPSILEEGSQRR